MQPIITMKFGSHLYGTDTPASDLDLKSVHLPSAEEILMQRVKDSVFSQTKADPSLKNTADDVDKTSFSLQKFLLLAAQGQTVAVDMLFAPPTSWIGDPTPAWLAIQENRHRLLTRQSASFVGYCRQQANKYGIRGSRVAAARKARDFLGGHALGNGNRPLGDLAEALVVMSRETEHMGLIDIPGEAGSVKHWEVCNKKMPLTASIKSAHDIMDRVVREYGHRALAAEKNEGVDWKALSHAVRIAEQAVELLLTGVVTFPRPEADDLRSIKLGKVPYPEVAGLIEDLLEEVEGAAELSRLPEKADQAWIDTFILEAYGNVVRQA